MLLNKKINCWSCSVLTFVWISLEKWMFSPTIWRTEMFGAVLPSERREETAGNRRVWCAVLLSHRPLIITKHTHISETFKLRKRADVPLRSRSASVFIGPELSTHTISLRKSPHREWDALGSERHAQPTLWRKNPHRQQFRHQPGYCSQSRTKVQKRLRTKWRIPLLYLNW